MNRTLHLAILLSLALHGALLFSLSVERKPSMREPPLPRLEARLVEAEPPATPPATPAPPPAAPAPPPAAPAPPPERKAVPKKVQKRAEPQKPAPPRVPEAKPVPEPEPRTEPPPVVQPEPEVVEPPAPAPAPPGVARVDPKPAPPAGPSTEQIEALNREQYRLALINAARRHNRYPPLARENNWEGEVLVHMVIDVNGAVSLSVQRSSSHEVLDRQALDMFRRAQAQVPLPPALRGKPLSFELKAIYSLKDQGSG